MRERLLSLLSGLVFTAVVAAACSSTDGSDDGNNPPGPGRGGAGGGTGGTGVGGIGLGGSGAALFDSGTSDGKRDPCDRPPIDKIDLLFMIDNSSSMADKQQILADVVPDLVTRLASPVCVDANKRVVARPKTTSEKCPDGSNREFKPITDIHIGVITSSLGSRGSDACQGAGNNDDGGHLINRGPFGNVPTWHDKGFLVWDPNSTAGGDTDLDVLTKKFADMVVGVGQDGCGFEAQLEAVYRFLVDPNPYAQVVVNGGLAAPDGTSAGLLQQRADFLRPDSLLAVISITDEDDCSITLVQGYLSIKGATSGFHMPRATSACANNPYDACCFSCGQDPPPSCTAPKDDPECKKGLWGSTEDAYNLRCFAQKRRYGVDLLYSPQRYVDGMLNLQVPDRDGKLVANPIYSDLPNSGKTVRDTDMVFWAQIVGVPWQDIAVDPNDLSKGYMDAKTMLAQGRWDVILGDPLKNQPPTDPFMIASIDPRTGKNPITGDDVLPPTSSTRNRINGHEWDTSINRDDLQYACVFPLPQSRDCASVGTNCDCPADPAPGTSKNPLCQNAAGGAYGTVQYYAKGYPGIRHLTVLKGLGAQGIAASVCPANLTDANALDYGYRPALNAVIDRLKERLNQCVR